MKYLTKNNKEQYTLPINVPAALAAKVSADVARIVEQAPPEAGRGMAASLRWWVGQFEHLFSLQAGVKLALDELDRLDYNWLAPEQQGVVTRVKMALTGCPTQTATGFTGELSPEYKERYG